MFKSKCLKCGKKVDNKYDFCPFCGASMKSREEDGFFGKKDIDTSEMQLPFGLRIMLKPLMKELNKQMSELDKEMKKSGKPEEINRNNFSSFSIRIDMPGQKPMKIENLSNRFIANPPIIGESSKSFQLPKIDSESLEKAKGFERKEAETNVRRLSDRVVYELFLPGLKSLKKINIAMLESGFSIKAIGDKTIYFKDLNVNLPFVNYYFKDEKLFIEFALK
jgi:hypothetical protein